MMLIKMRLSIFLVLNRYRLAVKYGIIFHLQLDPELRFLIQRITIVSQARLKQKLVSIYFLNKRCF